LTSDAYTTIRIWDALTGEMRDSLRVYDGSNIFSMDVSRDGQWFVLGRTYGGEIRNLDGKLTGSFAPNELVENVEFSHDGKRLAVSILGQYYEYNEIRVYDVQSWQIVWNYRKYDPQSLTEYWSIRFTPDDSKMIVAEKAGAARVFDAQTGVSYGAYYDASGIAMASYSTDGKRIVVGNGNGYAVVVDVATGSVINSIHVAAEGVPVDVAAFVPGSDNVFCIPRLGPAGIWETSSGALLRTFSPDIGGWSADFSPDGTSVVMGGGYVASIWDLETAQHDISDSVWSIMTPEPTDPQPTNPISLQPVYANLANETVALEYEVTVSGQTQLYLTDILGCRVATLVDDVVLPGKYVVQWNAAEQSSGMFFCVLQTPMERLVKPLMIKR
jgi:WD40 repeat protein